MTSRFPLSLLVFAALGGAACSSDEEPAPADALGVQPGAPVTGAPTAMPAVPMTQAGAIAGMGAQVPGPEQNPAGGGAPVSPEQLQPDAAVESPEMPDSSIPDAAIADASGESEVDAAEADAGQDAGQDAGEQPSVTELCTGVGGMVLQQTIVVQRGETFDGQCQRYIAGRALGDGSQAEGQQPLFRVEDGGRLINVVLGSPAADGVHLYGDVTLANIVWEDIGEDAMTIKASGTVELDGGSAVDGEDKVFQINAASTFRVSNFRANNAGKFIRQNGGTTFRVDVFIDNCDISNMDESIFRTDSSISSVTMTNTRYSNIGRELFMGVNPNNITQSGNQRY